MCKLEDICFFEQPPNRTFDYVLMGDGECKDSSLKRKAFIEQLKKKNISVTVSAFYQKSFNVNDLFNQMH